MHKSGMNVYLRGGIRRGRQALGEHVELHDAHGVQMLGGGVVLWRRVPVTNEVVSNVEAKLCIVGFKEGSVCGRGEQRVVDLDGLGCHIELGLLVRLLAARKHACDGVAGVWGCADLVL